MVMKYLDPKADLTFKKIFGNHPARLISLLNALLPLSEEEQIHEIKYLPTELVPQLEGGKNTIVDVLCTDVRGRKFCVEMQMEWSDAFQQRVLFNASKLYVSQANQGIFRFLHLSYFQLSCWDRVHLHFSNQVSKYHAL